MKINCLLLWHEKREEKERYGSEEKREFVVKRRIELMDEMKVLIRLQGFLENMLCGQTKPALLFLCLLLLFIILFISL